MKKIFVSYSHENIDWVSEKGKYRLIPWLKKSLKRKAEIWDDSELEKDLGERYEPIIVNSIKNSDIAILLISQDFADSDFINNVELPLIKQQYDNGKSKVIPLLISKLTRSGKQKLNWIFDLQTYPSDTHPILDSVHDHSKWEDIKVDILDGIENKIDFILKQESTRKEKELEKNILPFINKEDNVIDEEADGEELYKKGLKYWGKDEYKNAYDSFTKAALKKHTKSMIRIGELLEKVISLGSNKYVFIDKKYEYIESEHDGIGDYIREILEFAREWYKRAIDAGDYDGMYYMGVNYLNHWVNKTEEGIHCLEKAVEKGDVKSMIKLGDHYYNLHKSWTVEEEMINATKWFLKAHDLGNSYASFMLGEIHYKRLNESTHIAVEYYHAASEAGEFYASFRLGVIYYLGESGISKNYSKAYEYSLMAANNGNLNAMYIMGEMYFYGKGIPVNYDKAMEWYLKSAKKGASIWIGDDLDFYGGNVDYYPYFRVGLCYYFGYGTIQNFVMACKYFKSSDSPNALFFIGRLYFYGQGVDKNYKTANKYFKELCSWSSNENDSQPRYYLGLIYENGGYGIEKNIKESIKWYKIASELGNKDAKKKLKKHISFYSVKKFFNS